MVHNLGMEITIIVAVPNGFRTSVRFFLFLANYIRSAKALHQKHYTFGVVLASLPSLPADQSLSRC